MNKFINISLSLILLPLFISCSGANKREQIAKQRAEWEASLPDSLDKFRRQSKEIADSIPIASREAAEAMALFSSSPDYFVLKGWENKFPPQAPGMTARISKKGILEISAAADAPFSSMTVASENGYFTTSEFEAAKKIANIAGTDADSIVNIIANALGEVKITLGNSSFSLSSDQKEMIRQTYNLLLLNKRQTRLQKMLPALSRKIRATENMIEKLKNK